MRYRNGCSEEAERKVVRSERSEQRGLVEVAGERGNAEVFGLWLEGHHYPVQPAELDEIFVESAAHSDFVRRDVYQLAILVDCRVDLSRGARTAPDGQGGAPHCY
jgi:hypothetical protein